MNKYIIPVCNIQESDVYNLTINASSYSDCQDKIMRKFEDYTDKDDWHEFLEDLDNKDILIGRITDVEEL